MSALRTMTKMKRKAKEAETDLFKTAVLLSNRQNFLNQQIARVFRLHVGARTRLKSTTWSSDPMKSPSIMLHLLLLSWNVGRSSRWNRMHSAHFQLMNGSRKGTKQTAKDSWRAPGKLILNVQESPQMKQTILRQHPAQRYDLHFNLCLQSIQLWSHHHRLHHLYYSVVHYCHHLHLHDFALVWVNRSCLDCKVRSTARIT